MGISVAVERTCEFAKRFTKRRPETGGRHEIQIDQQKNIPASEFYYRRRNPAWPVLQAIDWLWQAGRESRDVDTAGSGKAQAQRSKGLQNHRHAAARRRQSQDRYRPAALRN